MGNYGVNGLSGVRDRFRYICGGSGITGVPTCRTCGNICFVHLESMKGLL